MQGDSLFVGVPARGHDGDRFPSGHGERVRSIVQQSNRPIAGHGNGCWGCAGIGQSKNNVITRIRRARKNPLITAGK